MTATCQRCEADTQPDARFCTQCGARVAPYDDADSSGADRTTSPPDGIPLLVECDACGASNAASRPLCARCEAPLRDEVPGGNALPADTRSQSGRAAASPRGSEASPVLLSLVVLTGLVIAGALLSLVTSRVTADAPVVPAGLTVAAATASSALPDFEAARAIDSDPSTAWTESAPGPGEEEQLELRMGEEVDIARVLIWNGDQADETSFAENGRVSVLRIEAAGRQFRVTLLDVAGPQAIDLPEVLRTDRIVLVMEEVIAGDRYNDLAISEVVIEGSR